MTMTQPSDVLAAVADKYGIKFSETHTGGGCMALESQLESGHWIVATDEGLCSLRERMELEEQQDPDGERTPQGWFIGIYLPEGADGGWWGDGTPSIVEVTDYDAFAGDLPQMVGRALAALSKTR